MLYNKKINLSEHFFYPERLIKCGKKKHGENILYLFEGRPDDFNGST